MTETRPAYTVIAELDDHRKDNERCAQIDCGPQPWCFWGLHLYQHTAARGSARCIVTLDVAKLFPGRIRQRAPISPCAPYPEAGDFREPAAGDEKNLPLPAPDRVSECLARLLSSALRTFDCYFMLHQLNFSTARLVVSEVVLPLPTASNRHGNIKRQ